MQRYFVFNDENWTKNTVTITGEDVHHIVRVMRSRVGDAIICTNQSQEAAICTISELSNDEIVAEIKEWLQKDVELPIDVTIAQGLPKGDKFEFILQKGTELGASSFIPFETERSIVRWDEKKMKKKQHRFEKIVKEASEQSHRLKIPSIQERMNLSQLIEASKSYSQCIFAYEEEARKDEYHLFSRVLSNLVRGSRLLICIGPEGGFTNKEAEILLNNHFQPVRFGPRILRTETAPLYALASISYQFEEIE